MLVRARDQGAGPEDRCDDLPETGPRPGGSLLKAISSLDDDVDVSKATLPGSRTRGQVDPHS